MTEECLQHYPMPMARFGLTPFGENRFRLVLNKSVRWVIYGDWDGSGVKRAKWVRKYSDDFGPWILEEWRDCFTLTGGMTAEQWNTGPEVNTGPYPSRGGYEMVGGSGVDPAHTNIEKLIAMVHAADKYSWNEKLVACQNQATKEEIERKHLRESIIRDAFPAFGHAPFSQLSTGRGGAAKTSPVLRSANELGLPVPQGIPGQATTGGGMVISKRKRRKAA